MFTGMNSTEFFFFSSSELKEIHWTVFLNILGHRLVRQPSNLRDPLPPGEILALGVYRLGHHRNSYMWALGHLLMAFHAITAKIFDILEIVRYYNTSQARTLMMKERELELNFPRASFSILPLQALTVTAVIPIIWLDFSKFCLPHLSTMASLMFCWCAKFLPMRKTWGRTKQKPAMTDFHHKLNTFGQRSPKCDPLVKNKRDFIRAQNTFYFSRDFDFKIWFRACEITGTFEKRVKG